MTGPGPAGPAAGRAAYASYAGIAPSDEDPVVRGMVEAVGGPPGRYAARPSRTFWTVERVVLALAIVVLALAWLQKAPCRGQPWAHQFQYTHVCYTDVYALYYAEGLADGKTVYLDHAVEYPVLTGYLMQVVAYPAHLFGANAAKVFFDLTALALGGLGLATVWAVSRLHRRRPWDAAMVALAPMMVLTAYVNWDLLAVALSTLALLAWARRHPFTAGLILGAGIAAKFYPLLFLGPLFVLSLRARRLREFGQCLAGASASWCLLNVPIALVAPDSWVRFFSLSSSRGADWGTFWYWLEHVTGRPVGTGVLNLAVALSLLVGCGLVALLGLSAPRRPRLAQLVFLTMAVFLITGKVWSQQYVLWLIPLAVLARPRWRAFLVWQAAELVYELAYYMELAGADRHRPEIPEWLFLSASAVRLAGLLIFCALVVVDVLSGEPDPVRAAEGGADPLAGVLTGEPDRLTLAAPALRLRTSPQLTDSAHSSGACPAAADLAG